MRRRICWFVGLCLAFIACERDKTSSPSIASAIRQNREGPRVSARRIALSVPHGSSAIDLELRQHAALARTHPSRLASWIDLGRAWVKKARLSGEHDYYVNADACVRVALEISPNDPLALDLRTLVLLNNHEFVEAKQLSESLIRGNPDSAMAWGSLSDALLELGEHEAAERAAGVMLDLKPNLPSYGRMSYLRWLRGDEAGAKELARLAIDSSDDPRHWEPRAWMIVQAAHIFWHAGDVSGADAGFLKALEIMPEYAPALVGRGRVMLASGNVREAGRLFERAQKTSHLVETTWLLGQARELGGDLEGAAMAYAEAEREGQRSDPRTLSLMLASQKREFDRALALAERERKTRADIYTEDVLAFALYRKGRLDEAKAAILRARRLGTPDARLLFHEGAIRLALGERVQGRQLLRQALAQNPHFDALSAREAAELLKGAS